MRTEFYEILFYSLFLTVGIFLLYYGLRYFRQRNKGNRPVKKYVKVYELPGETAAGEVEIRIDLPEKKALTLELLTAAGDPLRVLTENAEHEGEVCFTFDSRSLPDGAYFFRVSTVDQSLTRKLFIKNS